MGSPSRTPASSATGFGIRTARLFPHFTICAVGTCVSYGYRVSTYVDTSIYHKSPLHRPQSWNPTLGKEREGWGTRHQPLHLRLDHLPKRRPEAARHQGRAIAVNSKPGWNILRKWSGHSGFPAGG